MDVGKKIALLRRAKELTQKELAKEIGISTVYLSQIETGKYQHPSVRLLSRIAEALKAELDDLIDSRKTDSKE